MAKKKKTRDTNDELDDIMKGRDPFGRPVKPVPTPTPTPDPTGVDNEHIKKWREMTKLGL